MMDEAVIILSITIPSLYAICSLMGQHIGVFEDMYYYEVFITLTKKMIKKGLISRLLLPIWVIFYHVIMPLFFPTRPL